MAKIRKIDDKFYFDGEDGTEEKECKIWVETSKKNETHPEGKPWIVLPKENITNRTYFSLDKFEAENVDGEIDVEVKTTAPRVLGSTGVKQAIVKYLDEATAEEYTNLVNTAVEIYKASKATNRKKKPEEMNVEELQAYIAALESGEAYKAPVSGYKSFIDVFTDEEYNRYNEILALAQENKANAPRAKRGPMTDEEKRARKVKKVQNDLTKAQALLAALQAKSNSPFGDDEDEI